MIAILPPHPPPLNPSHLYILVWPLKILNVCSGHEVSLAQQYGLIAVCSIPFFLWAGAGGIVFWVMGASMFFITGHAAFYNYDALDVPEDQEPLVGAIVEEV